MFSCENSCSTPFPQFPRRISIFSVGFIFGIVFVCYCEVFSQYSVVICLQIVYPSLESESLPSGWGLPVITQDDALVKVRKPL